MTITKCSEFCLRFELDEKINLPTDSNCNTIEPLQIHFQNKRACVNVKVNKKGRKQGCCTFLFYLKEGCAENDLRFPIGNMTATLSYQDKKIASRTIYVQPKPKGVCNDC